MKAKVLMMTVGMLSGLASAEYYSDAPIEPRMPSEYNATASGKIYAGYDSRYDYKDMAVSSKLNESGVFRFGGEVDFNLFDAWKQKMGAQYLAFCDGNLSDKNGFDANWKAVRELLPNLSFCGGYEFNYGGLPGYLSKVTGKAPHSFSQSFTAGLVYDDPGHGYFGAVDLQYGFYGMQGWRLDLMAGKRWNNLIHEKVDLEVSVGTAYSWGYWGGGVDGFDQFNVRVAAPVRVTGMDEYDGLRVIPFIQLNWAGNNRSEMLRYSGFSCQTDCRLRVGIEAVYQF